MLDEARNSKSKPFRWIVAKKNVRSMKYYLQKNGFTSETIIKGQKKRRKRHRNPIISRGTALTKRYCNVTYRSIFIQRCKKYSETVLKLN